MSNLIVANKDTYINLMRDMDVETFIPKGTWMFHEKSDKQTKWLEPDEICMYSREHGTNFGYKGDWDVKE